MRVTYSLALIATLFPQSCAFGVIGTRPAARVPSSSSYAVAIATAKRPLITPLSATVEEDTSSRTSNEDDDIGISLEGLEPEYVKAYRSTYETLQKVIPSQYRDAMTPMLRGFLYEYLKAGQACYAAGGSNAEGGSPQEQSKKFLNSIQYALQFGFPGLSPTPYTFPAYHKAMMGRDPEKEGGNTIDLYKFGNDFFKSCIDVDASLVLGMDNLKKVCEQYEAGDNIIFLANHQTEADPQVVSLLLAQEGYKEFSDDVAFVAGHKVTTDPLAVPFSMGRNLLCIHSKKHINADPETKPIRQKQNLLTMSALTEKLREGRCVLWVAPSGGRDRRDLSTMKVPCAPFDRKTVDMFRLLANKAKNTTTRFYTLAMATYEFFPPPDHVEAGVGEVRTVRYLPTGIAIGDELPNVGGLESRDEFTRHAFDQLTQDYDKIIETLPDVPPLEQQQ